MHYLPFFILLCVNPFLYGQPDTMLVLLLAALVWVVTPCQTQTLDGFFQKQYEQLDKNALETGILIHQSPVFIWPGRYDGRNTADSMRVMLDQFGILYGKFLGAANQPEALHYH